MNTNNKKDLSWLDGEVMLLSGTTLLFRRKSLKHAVWS